MVKRKTNMVIAIIVVAVIIDAALILDGLVYMAVGFKHGPQYRYWPFSGFYSYFRPRK